MTAPVPSLAWRASEGLEGWLAAHGVALALTTYRANRLLLLGRGEEGGLSVRERTFDRPMGLFAEGGSLWLATRARIWRLDNHLAPGGRHQGGDRLYVPACGVVTGDVNAHEVVVPSRGAWAGQPLFVNTAFSCLARLERGCSFAPLWRPPFLARLAPDDACHLNGVALEQGEPTWATACGHQSGPSSWRHDRRLGGVVLHIPSDSVVATGLSMPHSPRWHRGRLWVLQSGSGELGWIADHRFQPLAALPGFTRGLAFVADCAVVGLSRLRTPGATGLALEERLRREGRPEGCCGLRVVDLRTGATLHSLELPEPMEELFDVVVLERTRQPLALDLEGEEITSLVRLPDRPDLVRLRPLAPGEPSPLAAPSPGNGPIRYQRVFHLTPDNLAPYSAITFPSLVPGRPALARVRGELLGVSAMAEGTMVALAIAERDAAGGARLLSLMVVPAWRRRGIGTGVLARLMAFLAEEGIRPLEARYKATPLTAAALEPILARLGWLPPRTDLLLLEGRAEELAAVTWADRHPIRAPYMAVPWGELGPERHQAIAGRMRLVEGPLAALEPGDPDPGLSLALLHQGEPVGWVTLQRVGPEAVRYTSLWVEEAHRGRARGLALLHGAFRRQRNAGLPVARAAIAIHQAPLLRLLRRHLAAHLRAIGEARVSATAST